MQAEGGGTKETGRDDEGLPVSIAGERFDVGEGVRHGLAFSFLLWSLPEGLTRGDFGLGPAIAWGRLGASADSVSETLTPRYRHGYDACSLPTGFVEVRRPYSVFLGLRSARRWSKLDHLIRG